MPPRSSTAALLARPFLREVPWLVVGVCVTLVAVATLIALMVLAGGGVAVLLAGSALAAPALLRLLGLGRFVARYLERLTTHEATFRALAGLRVFLFRGVAARGAGGLAYERSGDLVSRLVNDVDALDGLYLRIAVPAVTAAVLLPVLVWIVWHDDPLLAVLEGLLFAAAAIGLPLWAARSSARAAEVLAGRVAALRIACLDLLGGLREARAFGAEERLLTDIQRRQGSQQATLDRLAADAGRAGAAFLIAAQAGLLLALVAGVYLHRIPPGITVTLVFLIVVVFEAVAGLPRAGTLAGHIAVAAGRVAEAATAPPAYPPPARAVALPAGTSLKFEQVGFAWNAERGAVLENFTLDIPRGARVALLGPSGSGKSTIAALALRVVAPDSGRVLMGGTDLADLRPEDVRTRLAWLSQTTHLFADTIEANLRLARPAATDDELWAALDAAQIGETVRALPDRLHAWVGESGALFSGGQGRRLALARTLLSPAPLLILDEPCAGLDAQTEQDFLQTLNSVTEGRTLLLITHRLIGVEKLDRIYRLSAGHAVAAAG